MNWKLCGLLRSNWLANVGTATVPAVRPWNADKSSNSTAEIGCVNVPMLVHVQQAKRVSAIKRESDDVALVEIFVAVSKPQIIRVAAFDFAKSYLARSLSRSPRISASLS